MMQLCITVRWLDNRYHGLQNRDGPGEWPPSPFRLFQALLAGAAQHGKLDSDVGRSIEWIESLGPPLIIAPRVSPGQVVQRFVPNNDGNKKPDRQARLTGKTSRPTILIGVPEVHYLWPIPEAAPEAAGAVYAARYLSCVGWGIDMAYGNARVLEDHKVAQIDGVRWSPRVDVMRDDGFLRVPKQGSMSELLQAHESVLSRIEQGKPLHTVKKSQVFDRVFYDSAGCAIGQPYVFFALRKANEDFYSYPQAKLIHVAGMTRNAAIGSMREFPPEHVRDTENWVDTFVAGHRNGQGRHRQLSYIPLPSIGTEHADALIRRVMMIAPFGCDSELRHLADQLDGEQLQPEGGGERPVLDRLKADGVTRQYTGVSDNWASVTPVILPGHDDHKPEKTVKLVERALTQSGIEQSCQFTWGFVPNFPNTLAAFKYDRGRHRKGYFRPDHLEGFTSVHIRLAFEHPVAGPLAIGAGRHCGLGILAAQRVS